jgi:hypothetical protein
MAESIRAAILFEPGQYRYVPGMFQYSAGVAAEPGYEIERARFAKPMPIAAGFLAIEAHLKSLQRPPAALCACELRSPAPFSESGFASFNREYIGPLERWEIFRNEVNPVARSNVCPELAPPPSPSFFAFSYTVPARSGSVASFVIAGSGEAQEGKGSFRDFIVRRGDVSPAGLREKARWVLGEMERRMAVLGYGWMQATATQLYTVHDPHPFLAEELVARGAMPAGLTWHFCRPPMVELDYEMDVRGVAREILL